MTQPHQPQEQPELLIEPGELMTWDRYWRMVREQQK